jgi:ferredoxin--NADP+ reductase
VTVGNETKFVCVDGPEFDAHLVDFDTMMLRLTSFKTIEQKSNHECHLEKAIEKL